jgi:hypothetical protein
MSCALSTGGPGGLVDSPASTITSGLAALACWAAAVTNLA